MIYLDSAATTRMDDRVFGAMAPYMIELYGNPGTLYKLGRSAKEAVDLARAQVASLLGANQEQIIFTSGGSEANSLVFGGLVNYLQKTGKTHILVSEIEHDSVLEASSELIKHGFCVDKIPVTHEGIVSPDAVSALLRPDTGLISVMLMNNETGAQQPVWRIAGLCKQHGILLHTDCVQAAGCYRLRVEELGCDFASISSHKIHGPKGIGALYARDKSLLTPLIHGGSDQEFGLRGGTENVPGIVGFGKACAIEASEIGENAIEISKLRNLFYTQLTMQLKKRGLDGCIHVNGPFDAAWEYTPGKTLNLRIDGVDGETLLLMLDGEGVCVSAGSACRSHEAEPSRVLTAMGLSKEEARSSLRVSFSRMNTPDEMFDAAVIFADCIAALNG